MKGGGSGFVCGSDTRENDTLTKDDTQYLFLSTECKNDTGYHFLYITYEKW